jgi:peptidoglycan/LPS O-acetylase OafA/YrhL
LPISTRRWRRFKISARISTGSTASKSLALEGLRGLAAVQVVFWHATLAFAPRWSGYGVDSSPIVGSPVFLLINGSSAIVVFFLLSGYVLTSKFFAHPQYGYLVRGALKRWFRLAPMVLFGSLLGYLFMVVVPNHYAEAGKRLSSIILVTYGFPANGPPSLADDWGSAFSEGLFSVYLFIPGQPRFNPVLWTMRFELLGSLLAYALAGACVATRQSLVVRLLAYAVACGTTLVFMPFMAPFVAGVAMADLSHAGVPELSSRLRFWIAVIGLYFLGYFAPVGWYSWLDGMPVSTVHLMGSICLVAALCYGETPLTPRQSRIASWLGKLSFALYVVHLPLLLGAGSWLYLTLLAEFRSELASVVAALLSMVMAVLLAIPVAALDSLWVKKLNRTFNRSTDLPASAPKSA